MYFGNNEISNMVLMINYFKLNGVEHVKVAGN